MTTLNVSHTLIEGTNEIKEKLMILSPWKANSKILSMVIVRTEQ